MSRLSTSRFYLLLVVVFLLVVIATVPAAAGITTRLSVASDATQGDAASTGCSTSADGRYVAFMSAASTLVDGDTNGVYDIFVRDCQTGTTSRVSVASNGTQGNAESYIAEISADGRYVAFESLASNLVAGDTNGIFDVFVHDCQTGITTRVSVASNGTQGNGDSYFPAISADGRYVAFESLATNLVAGDTNNGYDIFLHDLQTGTTTRVSIANNGTQGNIDSFLPAISANGRYVAYESFATNLVAGDTNGAYDVFVYDCQTGITTRVSVASDGTQGNAASEFPTISADGRYVAYESLATNLVTGDTNVSQDIFLHDCETGTTTRVSVSSEGTPGDADSFDPSLSADGRYVAYESLAANLVAGDTNGKSDVFVYDGTNGETRRHSVASDGTQGNDGSYAPSLSADGSDIAFDSAATNLVNADTNSTYDIFMHNIIPPLTKVTLAITPSATGVVGQPVTLTAISTGGTNIEYSFRAGYQDAAGVWIWTDLSTPLYQTAPTFTWTPAVARTWMLVVYARKVGSTARYDIHAYQSYTVTPPAVAPSALRLTVSPTPTAPVGTRVTLTAIPTGGTNIEYGFRAGYQDAAGVWIWTDLSTPLYQTAPTFTWTPAVARTWMLVVYARKVGSTARYDIHAYQSYTVTPPPVAPSAVRLTVSPTPTAPVGTPVTLTAIPTGGTNIEYRFRAGYKDAAGVYQWTELSSPLYQSTPTCTWTPPTARTWMLVVYVRRVGRTGYYDVTAACNYTVTSPTVAPSAVRLTVSPTPTAPVGTPVTLTAIPTGGTNIEYRFRAGYKDAAGVYQWTELSSPLYQSTPTCTWTPPTARTWMLVVYVRRVGRTGYYDVTAACNYTVTPPAD